MYNYTVYTNIIESVLRGCMVWKREQNWLSGLDTTPAAASRAPVACKWLARYSDRSVVDFVLFCRLGVASQIINQMLLLCYVID